MCVCACVCVCVYGNISLNSRSHNKEFSADLKL